MKPLKLTEASAMIHSDPDTGLWGYSEINLGSAPALDFRSGGNRLEKSGGESSPRGSGLFDSSSTATSFIARVPRRLWLEFMLYTIATIAIQMLCHIVK